MYLPKPQGKNNPFSRLEAEATGIDTMYGMWGDLLFNIPKGKKTILRVSCQNKTFNEFVSKLGLDGSQEIHNE